MSESYDDYINRIEREHYASEAYGSDDNSLPPDESASIYPTPHQPKKLIAAQDGDFVITPDGITGVLDAIVKVGALGEGQSIYYVVYVGGDVEHIAYKFVGTSHPIPVQEATITSVTPAAIYIMSEMAHTAIVTATDLENRLQAALRALSSIVERAEEAQGEWVSVQEPYAPDWCDPFRKIIEIANRAL